MIAESINQKDDMSCGARLVATDGRVLSLRSAALRVDAKAGLARVVLEQRFANAYGEPLMVRYAVPLPHDGVVSTYAFSIADRRIVGEVDRRAAARERFEQALIEGYTAALLEQDRSSLFTQDIGNIPPGVDVVCEIVVDQRLRWLDEGLWEWRFPTVVAPRYLGRRPSGGAHADVAYGLLTLVPPAPAEHSEPLSRDVIVLLDTSGSMSGEPIEQARRLVAALIETLGDRDRLEMLAFSSTAQRWRPTPVAATRHGTTWMPPAG